MRSQTISAACLLLVGVAIGLWFSPARLIGRTSGELMPRERTVEAGMNVDVYLRLRDRPLGSMIHWYAEKGEFHPAVTASDLRSTFTAPPEQGRVRIWVDVEQGERVYHEVAFGYLDVARPAVAAGPPNETPLQRPQTNEISIDFVTVPPYDIKGGPTTSADIEGQVKGVANPDQYFVVLYAKTVDTWWVQPLAASRLTTLDRNGQFFNWTHTGTQYAAILVKKGYIPPEAVEQLPTSGTSPEILASKVVKGKTKGE